MLEMHQDDYHQPSTPKELNKYLIKEKTDAHSARASIKGVSIAPQNATSSISYSQVLRRLNIASTISPQRWCAMLPKSEIVVYIKRLGRDVQRAIVHFAPTA